MLKILISRKLKKKPEVKNNGARLKNTYDKEIINNLIGKLSLKNKHEVPKFKKIVLNMGLGEDASDGKKLKACVDDMSLITGQKPVITKFKNQFQILKQERVRMRVLKLHWDLIKCTNLLIDL